MIGSEDQTMDTPCTHEWRMDLWMSAYTTDPNIEDALKVPRPLPVPLARCVHCGAIRLLVAGDAPRPGTARLP
jgi:hypothetical protein